MQRWIVMRQHGTHRPHTLPMTIWGLVVLFEAGQTTDLKNLLTDLKAS